VLAQTVDAEMATLTQRCSAASNVPRCRCFQIDMACDVLTFFDAERPSWSGDGPRPVRAHLWRPARGDGGRGTILVSHGSGGAARQMAWLNERLAGAGFLAIAVDHHGNNIVDGYLAEGFACWWERPRDLSFVLDQLGEHERLGPVGAAGFSLGGYTAAALLGARIDASRYEGLFSGTVPAKSPPEYPTLAQELRERLSAAEVARWVADARLDYADDRVLAGFLISPGVGLLLDEESLAAIDKPVAVRWAGADEAAPPPDDARLYADLIPGADGRSVGDEVSHYAFLDDNPEFADVRRLVASEALTFFEANLR
jgi:predicted dienelactone hydrolase